MWSSRRSPKRRVVLGAQEVASIARDVVVAGEHPGQGQEGSAAWASSVCSVNAAAATTGMASGRRLPNSRRERSATKLALSAAAARESGEGSDDADGLDGRNQRRDMLGFFRRRDAQARNTDRASRNPQIASAIRV